MMPSLSELQGRFAAALAGPGIAAGIADLFSGPGGRVAAGLAIYRGNFQGNCATALAGAYPIVRKIVGQEFFEELARAHVRTAPSKNADLNLYGDGFPAFLAEFPPVADLLYLPDVARMEWKAHQACFATDSVPFDSSSLARVRSEAYGELRLRLAPHCSLFDSPWPLERLWAVHQDDYDGPFDIDLDGMPDRVLVYRAGWRPRVESLEAGDYRFLEAALRGETLGAALEAALAADSQFNPSTALGRWINAQIIVGME
jgi:uncharacterized protein